MAELLSVQGLRAGYGRIPILMGIDFTLAPGEFLGILGHNGMGKTTLIRSLMGYLPATAGRITLDGRDVTAAKPAQKAAAGIGYVPQGRQIFPDLSVFENLRMGQAGKRREDKAVIDQVLSLFPRLTRLLDRRGGALSGGEQQLLALARCLCTQPRIILLDEPTEGIQPNILDEIVETLQDLRRQSGIAMILVEQNLEFLTALSDRLLIIQKGVITDEVSPDMMADPERIADFVGMHA
ncbi:ABC transporter ATP-binding protein [Tistrella bauzanensis]|uniref:ABC transporter ATP-binding protein n=1 Tax=Tistrella bauzanensis TaxID=657419 RepID=A0ABQ1J5J5_9PROT|nr:ABC transporter ATP-binding protein [Tistrella bauzanensis]GGB58488.1 ABC transporter ATP-binding protein [Tistrella bauzanensis]